jgi:Flp pilus assembly protein CpaB
MRSRPIITSVVLPLLATSALGCAVVCDEYGSDESEMIPTWDVVVAARTIEQGTAIDADMVTVRTVPVDATSEMAFSDPTQVRGEVAAIDILLDQIIMPNMLSGFPYVLPPDPDEWSDEDLIEVEEEGKE